MHSNTVRVIKKGQYLGLVTKSIKVEDAIALQITFYNNNVDTKWFFKSSIEFI